MHSVARVVRLVAATHKLALLNNQIFNTLIGRPAKNPINIVSVKVAQNIL